MSNCEPQSSPRFPSRGVAFSAPTILADDAERLAKLTVREREVMEQAAIGLHAKEIAADLGISPRTVEVHKTRLMAKLGVRNVAELVRFTLTRKSHPSPD